MMAHLNMVKNKGMEDTLGKMIHFMKVNLKIIWLMEKECIN
jgi:hypothetical protein